MSSLFPSGYTSHDISPTAVSDLAKKKDYWRGGKDEKAFYSAQVMELGVTKAELIQRMSKRKITAMDFEESEPGTTVAQIHESAAVGPCQFGSGSGSGERRTWALTSSCAFFQCYTEHAAPTVVIFFCAEMFPSQCAIVKQQTSFHTLQSSTSMDPAAPQNPGILLRLPLAWVLLHHGTQVFLLRSMASGAFRQRWQPSHRFARRSFAGFVRASTAAGRCGRPAAARRRRQPDPRRRAQRSAQRGAQRLPTHLRGRRPAGAANVAASSPWPASAAAAVSGCQPAAAAPPPSPPRTPPVVVTEQTPEAGDQTTPGDDVKIRVSATRLA
ncbi:hypothetical protein V5799_007604, partial [Amblyomma americanum]